MIYVSEKGKKNLRKRIELDSELETWMNVERRLASIIIHRNMNIFELLIGILTVDMCKMCLEQFKRKT